MRVCPSDQHLIGPVLEALEKRLLLDGSTAVVYRPLPVYDVGVSANCILVSSDGNYIAIGYNKGVRLLDSKMSFLWDQSTEHPIIDLTMTADNAAVIAGGSSGYFWGGEMYNYDLSGHQVWSLAVHNGLSSVCYSPDGAYLGVTYTDSLGWNDTVALWGDAEDKWLWNYSFGRDETTAVAVSLNGDYVAVGGAASPLLDAGRFRLYNKAGEVVQDYAIDESPLGGDKYSISISGDGQYIATGNRGNSKLYFFDRDQGLLWDYNVGNVRGACVSGDGSRIAVTTADLFVLLDRDKAPLWTWQGSDIRDISISRNADTIAVLTGDDKVRLFVVGTGEPVITSSLALTQDPPYHVGQQIEAVFGITNRQSTPVTFNVLTVGGRDPDGQLANFTWQRDITLNAGQTYQYDGTLVLTKAGNYHFFCAYTLGPPEGPWNTAVPAEEGATNVLDITAVDTAPTLLLDEPTNNVRVSPGQTIGITWTDSDPDDDAQISLAYDTDDATTDWTHHTLIASGLSEDAEGSAGHYDWNTAGVPLGTYPIWAKIDDGTNSPVYSRAAGRVTVTSRTEFAVGGYVRAVRNSVARDDKGRIRTVPGGSVGVIAKGPKIADNNTSWYVDYGKGSYTGWSPQADLETMGGSAWLYGIDVHSGSRITDWNEIKCAHDFALIRTSQGTLPDKMFSKNVQEALSAPSTLIGAWHVAYPRYNQGLEGADAEAETFVAVTWPWLQPGSVRPILDVEEGGCGTIPTNQKKASQWKADLLNWVHEWLTRVEELTGLVPLVYVNHEYYGYLSTLFAGDASYGVWISAPTATRDVYGPSPSFDWDIWQYNGQFRDQPAPTVPGVQGAVDTDVIPNDPTTLDRIKIGSVTAPIILRSFRAGNPLLVVDMDGTIAKLTLTGSGSGQVSIAGDSLYVSLTGTTRDSTLTIAIYKYNGWSYAGTDGRISIQDITIGNPSNPQDRSFLGSLNAPAVFLTGDLTVTGALGNLVLGDLVGGGISIGSRPTDDSKTTVAIRLGQVRDSTITSGTPLKSLTITEWLDSDGAADRIQAPSLGTLKTNGRKADVKAGITVSAGDFQADISLTGAAPSNALSLGSLTAAGAVTGTWTLAGGAGAIRAGSFAPAWQADFGPAGARAAVTSITSTLGDISGTVNARSVGSLTAKAELKSAAISLTLGPDAVHKTLNNLSVGTWIESSSILSVGSIGVVSAAGIKNSSVLAGVTAARDVQGAAGNPDGVWDLPETSDLAAPQGTAGLVAKIGALTLRGIKDAQGHYTTSLVNSSMAAGGLGRISLCYAAFDNDGNPPAHDVPFGLTGRTLTGLTYKDADRSHNYTWKKTDGTNLPAWFDDLALRLA
jgi:GH25 family lysozyme M1 (1,4-beta-N-acetylmuramidase)